MSNVISFADFQRRALELAERDGCHALSRLDRDMLGLDYSDSQPKMATRQDVTVRLLDSGPTIVPELTRSETPRNAAFLTRLIDHLHETAQSHDYAELICVTLTAPAGYRVRDTLDLGAWQSRTYGGWYVVEVTASGHEHIHGLVVADTVEDAQGLVDAHVLRHGLAPDAQHCAVEYHWRSSRPRRGIFAWARYVLATDKYARKRTRPDWEAPISGISWGCFAGAEELSRWAYADRDTLARYHVGPARDHRS